MSSLIRETGTETIFISTWTFQSNELYAINGEQSVSYWVVDVCISGKENYTPHHTLLLFMCWRWCLSSLEIINITTSLTITIPTTTTTAICLGYFTKLTLTSLVYTASNCTIIDECYILKDLEESGGGLVGILSQNCLGDWEIPWKVLSR
jgi:hypothetical protein